MVDRHAAMNDLDKFDQKLKHVNFVESSEEEDPDEYAKKPAAFSEADIVKEKNKILMEKLFKS